ncbi:ABC transporter substrate-binding protein [Hydrogenophaga sp.]|uniref:ABC transporter substrate-binding protein n=1 Tax=Hydrogenophaga sp. TaxID=1904254 RepID=UPI0035AF5DAB
MFFFALLASGQGWSQTLRWASQGDLLTLDPHAQNEVLTNSINSQVYETLVQRGKQMNIEPALAMSWERVSPLLWRFRLRPGVRFHDGATLTPEDVVFSVLRAREPTSAVRVYANALGTPKAVGSDVVEFALTEFNPVFLEHLSLIHVMNKAWAQSHGASQPQDFKAREEKYTALHANGTGPYMLVSRQPDVRTVFRRNDAWWGKPDGNVQEVVYTPVKDDTTRTAALLSGELDFVLDPPTQDLDRLRANKSVRVMDGPENRIMYFGLDQGRDELLYANVKGKNPFKDVRVRRALYRAIDIQAIRDKVMRGQAIPSGALAASPQTILGDAELDRREPFDPDSARQLMKEAGYPEGFEVVLDCPNNRYVNDEAICVAVAAMWARIGIKVRVNAMPRALYFPKLEKLDTSAYLMGWGGSITDAETTLTPVMRNRGERGVGMFNWGNYRNDKLDQLAAQSTRETDPARREQLIKAAMREHNEQVHHIPLHRQMIAWAMRDTVTAVHRPDNWLEWRWVRMDKR